MQADTESVGTFLEAAVGGTILGILLGSFNRELVGVFLIHTPINWLVSFLIGGVVAGAIQGGFIRRHIPSPWIWLSLSSICWLIAGGLDMWLPRELVWYKLCIHIIPYILVGGLRGIIIGSGQSLAFWQHSQLVRLWIIVNLLVWPALLVVGILVDSFFQRFVA
ncbi:MAG: hypothetical protein ABIV47_05985 [Roseiflexaceae bacterium]